jgi:hypothetical protein
MTSEQLVFGAQAPSEKGQSRGLPLGRDTRADPENSRNRPAEVAGMLKLIDSSQAADVVAAVSGTPWTFAMSMSFRADSDLATPLLGLSHLQYVKARRRAAEILWTFERKNGLGRE